MLYKISISRNIYLYIYIYICKVISRIIWIDVIQRHVCTNKAYYRSIDFSKQQKYRYLQHYVSEYNTKKRLSQLLFYFILFAKSRHGAS